MDHDTLAELALVLLTDDDGMSEVGFAALRKAFGESWSTFLAKHGVVDEMDGRYFLISADAETIDDFEDDDMNDESDIRHFEDEAESLRREESFD